MASKKAGNGEMKKIQGKEDDKKSLRGCQGAAGWKRSASEVRTGRGSEKETAREARLLRPSETQSWDGDKQDCPLVAIARWNHPVPFRTRK